MKYGIACNNLLGRAPSPDDVIRFAREAERIGYYSVSVGEHVLMPKVFDASTYPAGTFDPDVPWYDPIVFLAALAGVTKTIRLCTGVAVVAYRQPIQQAQAMATLDFMSGGRFSFGAGVGWMRQEFDALGVPFEERGRRADEYLEVIKLLWSGSDQPFHGEFIDFEGGRISPLPIQKPHPPILIGGETPPAIRRIAKYGDGFYINWKTLPEFEAILDQLTSSMAGTERQVSDLYKQMGATDIKLVQSQKQLLTEYEEIGLDEIVFSPKCHSVEEGFYAMKKFADEFM